MSQVYFLFVFAAIHPARRAASAAEPTPGTRSPAFILGGIVEIIVVLMWASVRRTELSLTARRTPTEYVSSLVPTESVGDLLTKVIYSQYLAMRVPFDVNIPTAQPELQWQAEFAQTVYEMLRPAGEDKLLLASDHFRVQQSHGFFNIPFLSDSHVTTALLRYVKWVHFSRQGRSTLALLAAWACAAGIAIWLGLLFGLFENGNGLGVFITWLVFALLFLARWYLNTAAACTLGLKGTSDYVTFRIQVCAALCAVCCVCVRACECVCA